MLFLNNISSTFFFLMLSPIRVTMRVLRRPRSAWVYSSTQHCTAVYCILRWGLSLFAEAKMGGICLTTAQILYSKVAVGLVRGERRPLWRTSISRKSGKGGEDDRFLVLLTDGLAAFFCCYNFLLFLEKPTLAGGASDVLISFETCIDYVVDSVGFVCW